MPANTRVFTLDRERSITEQVYEDLRDRIISLDFKPGTNLARPFLVNYYGVSRTPVRDSILKLDQDGLVDIFPQSRTTIAPIDVENAKETLFMRTSLELEVTHALATMPDKTRLAPAVQIARQQQAVLEKGEDLPQFTALDQKFHQSLFEAMGYAGLWSYLVQKSGHLDRLRRLNLPTPGKSAQILADHREILRALHASDLQATEKIMRKHLSGILNVLETITARHPDYF